VRGPGEVANGEGGRHDRILGLPLCEGQTPNPLLSFPRREGRRSRSTVLQRDEDAMSTTAGTVGRALVTGSTHGIGRAAALRLARDGWDVVVHGRNAERGAEVVAAIEAEGGRARFVAAELMYIDEIQRLAEEAGEVDVLVNNVGGSRFGPTADLD